jgi:DNA-binding MarR family transcriptional regulator
MAKRRKQTGAVTAQNLGRELSTAMVLFHEALASRLGLNATEWRCLGLLDLHGKATAGQLAQWSGLTTGAITGIANRLQEAGYVRRERNPDDRRSVILHPVRFAELRAKVAPALTSLGNAMAEMSREYTSQELLAIESFLHRMSAILREEAAKVDRPRGDRQ